VDSTTGESRPKRPKTPYVSRRCFGVRISGCARDISFVDYLQNGRTVNGECYVYGVIGAIEGRNCEKTTTTEVQCTVSQVDRHTNRPLNCFPVHRVLRIWLPGDYYLFADLKRTSRGKRFGPDEEAIAETEAYFEAKDKSFYEKGIVTLEKRWNERIALKGDCVNE